MKAVILAGGYGTRISEESHLKPKPMIKIGEWPILWHIMKIYSHHGINDFIVCLGYKGYVIKEYFANYFLHMSDVTFDMRNNDMTVHQKYSEPWTVTLVDTGLDTMTGGRLKNVRPYLDEDEDFCMTYGDGVSDIDITASLKSHKESGKMVTMTAVAPPGRYGALEIDGNTITNFKEKPAGDGGLINGGFFIINPKALDYIEGDQTSWEWEPLSDLVKNRKVNAYRHEGFWQPMDTLRDKKLLESLWASDNPPWKVWK